MASSDTCDCGSFPPDVNHGPSINAVNWTEAGLGVLILLIRLYTRAFIVRKIGWDDWCIVLAVVRLSFLAALLETDSLLALRISFCFSAEQRVKLERTGCTCEEKKLTADFPHRF